MLVNVKEHLSKNKVAYISITMGTIGLGVTSFVSYRLGAQHGVDVVASVLQKYDPNLWEQVNNLCHQLISATR